MKIPEIHNFFLESSLYEKFDYTPEEGNRLFDLLFFRGKIDCYCPSCDKESTFEGDNACPNMNGFEFTDYSDMVRFGKVDYRIFINKIHQIDFHCTRNESHFIQFSVCLTDTQIFKVGQYPSIAELSQPELKKYRSVLTAEKYSELNRGIGLITHGVGIGSFVYLRRIFEYLIEEAHQKVKSEDGWNEDEYISSRMVDKIGMLASELPEFLVQNKTLYSILSVGIHELTENDCKEYFPTVRLGIELILDEKLEKKRKADKIKTAAKSIQKINQEIKGKQ